MVHCNCLRNVLNLTAYECASLSRVEERVQTLSIRLADQPNLINTINQIQSQLATGDMGHDCVEMRKKREQVKYYSNLFKSQQKIIDEAPEWPQPSAEDWAIEWPQPTENDWAEEMDKAAAAVESTTGQQLLQEEEEEDDHNTFRKRVETIISHHYRPELKFKVKWAGFDIIKEEEHQVVLKKCYYPLMREYMNKLKVVARDTLLERYSEYCNFFREDEPASNQLASAPAVMVHKTCRKQVETIFSHHYRGEEFIFKVKWAGFNIIKLENKFMVKDNVSNSTMSNYIKSLKPITRSTLLKRHEDLGVYLSEEIEMEIDG